MTEENKSTTKQSTKKTQKVKINLSVYKFKGKVVSCLGVENDITSVEHKITKKDIPEEGWFKISSDLTAANVFSRDIKNKVLGEILGSYYKVVKFPRWPVNQLPTKLGELEHEFLEIELDL